MHAVLASIPSRGGESIELGPLTIRAYGLMLLLGIVACFWLTSRRWRAAGATRPWCSAPACGGSRPGSSGSGLPRDHELERDPDEWWGVFAVWKGGLGLWGGVALGLLVAMWVVHRAGASVFLALDAVAPGLLLAQGIGKFGNYFNQELFGKPTDLPWALEISAPNRPN